MKTHRVDPIKSVDDQTASRGTIFIGRAEGRKGDADPDRKTETVFALNETREF